MNFTKQLNYLSLGEVIFSPLILLDDSPSSFIGVTYESIVFLDGKVLVLSGVDII